MRRTTQLDLKRCPYCSIANPNIYLLQFLETNDANGANLRMWHIYKCNSCGGVIVASSYKQSDEIIDVIPAPKNIDDCIPDRARDFLNQSLESIHAPAGSIMLSASSIDAMLKDKGYMKGSLYERIDKATNDHLITEGMSQWAHQIRLEANDQRHADDKAALPTKDDAKRIVEFALALADFLYVLPDKVNKGIEDTKE